MKRFMELPKEFRYGIEREIEKVLDEYAAIAVRSLKVGTPRIEITIKEV